MTENARRLTIALPWAAVAAAGLGLIAWGDTRSRLAAVEIDTARIAADQRASERAQAEQAKQIAVIQSRLDTIIQQQTDILRKLERMERRQ